MDMMALIAAFGGGLIGAYLGALPAFIMTGFVALAGGIVVAAGGADISVGFIAFGSYLGPHIAFAGGVAAAAYAGKKGKIAAGGDITIALNGLASPDVLCVGGIFGLIGYVVLYLISLTPVGPMTDLPGITVVISAIIARLAFGSTGLTGKYTGSTPRVWFSGGNTLTCNILLGAGVGIGVSFVAASMMAAGVSEAAMGIYPVICFGISAITLFFTLTGFAVPATHHIALPAASAAVVGIMAFGSSGALLGVIFGIAGSLLGDFAGNTFNSHADTHIDPPAFAIFILIIVNSLIKSAIL